MEQIPGTRRQAATREPSRKQERRRDRPAPVRVVGDSVVLRQRLHALARVTTALAGGEDTKDAADSERTLRMTLGALMRTIEAKDEYTASHEEEVAALSERVALRLGLSHAQAREVRHAALLHDIGKIAVPSEILLKPGPLTAQEWATMRAHAAQGAELLAGIEPLAHLADAVRASHERWDGAGYPDGLAGEQIPLAARIIAACDSYSAIVTDRPYRAARSPVQAAAELVRVAGSQLDVAVVRALSLELRGRTQAAELAAGRGVSRSSGARRRGGR